MKRRSTTRWRVPACAWVPVQGRRRGISPCTAWVVKPCERYWSSWITGDSSATTKSTRSARPSTAAYDLTPVSTRFCTTTLRTRGSKGSTNVLFSFSVAEDLKLCYSIRDMIVTNAVPVPKLMHPRGFCRKITVRSQCNDASLVIDGGIAVPFDYGTVAKVEIFPEDSLYTITLPDWINCRRLLEKRLTSVLRYLRLDKVRRTRILLTADVSFP